ncbi:MAG: thiamine phosphate synthase [Planctomycetaceae bacterium]|nr:thiamine phosphate synthase [Planctomycetaceae bacterium]
MNNPVARIMDVNFNRAGEALRTLEEYARFVLDSAAMSSRCKTLRHSLAVAIKAWNAASAPTDQPLPNRDIAGDVGAAIKTDEEGSRLDAAGVAAAAARRAAEALRVLSEYAKIDRPALAVEFERIRYGLYDLEPVLMADSQRRNRLASAQLYILVTTGLCSTDARTAAREAVAGGADMIQLREKEMEDGEFHRLASDIADICRDGGALFIINDRPHIASLVDADGVHGGQGDLPVHLIRRILGPDKIIGRSTSGPDFAKQALSDGADYIGVGPVFETDTKKHRAAAGPEYVSWVSSWGGLPYFAIGGVNRHNIDAVIAAGARSVAICTAVTKAADIAAETAFFKDRLASGR